MVIIILASGYLLVSILYFVGFAYRIQNDIDSRMSLMYGVLWALIFTITILSHEY